MRQEPALTHYQRWLLALQEGAPRALSGHDPGHEAWFLSPLATLGRARDLDVARPFLALTVDADAWRDVPCPFWTGRGHSGVATPTARF